MKKNLVLLLIIILLNVVISIIVVPFKGNNLSYTFNISNNKNFLEDFIMSTFYNNLYAFLGIGRPSQYIVVDIIQNQVDFLFNKMNCLSFYNNKYIDKNNLYLNNRTIPINITKIGYNKNLSKTFSKNNVTNWPASYKNNNYLPGLESLIIDDYRNILTKSYEKKQIYPFSQNNLIKFGFVYEDINITNEEKNKDSEICGSIGLALYYDKNNNKFIEQLKSSNITTNYYWSFNYTSLDRGFIIFGFLPHEYNPSEYKADDLMETYTNIDEGIMKWSMDLNEIYFYSDKNTKNEKISVKSLIAEGDFEFSLQLIVGSYSYQELITEYFFKDYYDKNICFEEEYNLNIKYSIIRCKKEDFEKNIINFPKLFLYNRALLNVFELSYEDLFISIGDYIYFLVIFRKGGLYQTNQTWKLGIPFLKKHHIIFNTDTKRIGYYVKVKNNNNNNNNDKENKKNEEIDDKDSVGFLDKIKNFISLRTLLEIIIIIIFIVILIYLGRKLYYYKKKQKKPYELQDEDYDYFPDKSNLKMEKNNIDTNNNINDNN